MKMDHILAENSREEITDIEETHQENSIQKGNYIIIQRNSYFKLHLLNEGAITLGKDKVDLSAIIGQTFWSMFKMVPKIGFKREYMLEKCNKVESLSDAVMRDVECGSDNRNITDDGKSQKLSTEEIVNLRDSGLSQQNIVGILIENSKTFKNKTEYSQEKYLKKKEKKYFEYLIIRRPTIRLLAEILFNKDQYKFNGLRCDTLSQILTAANIQSSSTYILFETGTQALVGASILTYLGNAGTLINLTLGNQPQKQAILAMNFNKKKLGNFLSVKIKTLIDCLYEKKLQHDNESKDNDQEESSVSILADAGKRKVICENGDFLCKRPRWAEELERATSLLQNQKADGFVIACKEYSLELILKFIPFLKPSRPLVIFSQFREPLMEIYVELKKRKDIIGLHLTENWLRAYQVLPDRTHPIVTMNANGGFILTGTVVNCV